MTKQEKLKEEEKRKKINQIAEVNNAMLIQQQINTQISLTNTLLSII